MSTKMKLVPIKGGRWAIARTAKNGDFIGLIENAPVDSVEEARQVLSTLALPGDEAVLDRYFPLNDKGKRCPTFALMSLWYDLSPALVEDSINRV